MRGYAESGLRRMRLGSVGWLASSVVAIAICGTTAAQDDGSKPPDLIPIPLPGPLKPLSDLHYPALDKADRDDTVELSTYFEHLHLDLPGLTVAQPRDNAHRTRKSPRDDLPSRRRAAINTIAYWDEEIRMHSDRADAYYQRAILRARGVQIDNRHAIDAVIADLSETLKRDPNHLKALAFRGCILVENDDDSGVKDIERVLKLNPRHNQANYARALAFYKGGDFDAALDRLGRIGNISGETAARVHYLRCQCLAEKGRYGDAIASLTESMASYEIGAERYLERARLYHDLGICELARADVAEYIRLREKNLYSRITANLMLLQIGELGISYLDAERLRCDHPDDPFPYLLRFAARYMDACRRDRFLRQVEKVAGQAGLLLPVQPIPSMIRTSSHALTGLGRELALKDMEHGLDLIGRLTFPYACGALVNGCEGRVIPTCRDTILAAVRFNPRHFQFGLSYNRMRHLLSFSFREAEHLDADPSDQRDCSQVLEIIFLALDSAGNPES